MKNNNIKKSIKEIRTILDKDYFHTCTEVHENGVISWQVYYKNLPAKAYYSSKNKPLLTSEKNAESDIYKLRDKFEKEKEKELMKALKEIIPLGSEINNTMEFLQRNLANFAILILLTLIAITYINMFFVHNVIFSIAILIAVIVSGLLSTHFQNKNYKQIRKTNKKIIEIYVKQKIRNQGFFFVDRIKIGG